MSGYNTGGSIPPPYDAQNRIYNNNPGISGGVTYYNDPPKPGCCAKMGRIPFLSLLGIVLLGTGCAFMMLGYKTFAPGLFETYDALNFTSVVERVWTVGDKADFADFVREESAKGKDSYYSPENPTYIIVDSILCGVCLLYLLIVAVISSGLTRESCCQARTCCQGYAMFVHFTTALVVLLFLGFFLFTGILFIVPLFLTYYLDDQCTSPQQTTRPCFTAADFALSYPTPTSADDQICMGDDGLCARLSDMQLGFWYFAAGSFGAALGSVFVLMSNAANFAHFNDMKKVESEEKYISSINHKDAATSLTRTQDDIPISKPAPTVSCLKPSTFPIYQFIIYCKFQLAPFNFAIFKTLFVFCRGT